MGKEDRPQSEGPRTLCSVVEGGEGGGGSGGGDSEEMHFLKGSRHVVMFARSHWRLPGETLAAGSVFARAKLVWNGEATSLS